MWTFLKRIAPSSREQRILFVCAAVFFVLFALTGLLVHENLRTSAHDLGVFDQAYWRYSKLHDTFNTVLGFSILGDHFGILPVIFGPLYAIYPSVAWPIAAQALSVTLAGLILFAIARLRIPGAPVVALAIALAYYLQPAVHSFLLWQFHEIGLAAALYMGLIWSYVKGNRKLLIACLVALLACREDMPVTVAAFGVLALLDRRWRDGAWAIGLAVAWWVFATKVAMPIFNGHGYWQTQPGRPLAPLLDNIANPSFYLERFADPQSIRYLFQVLFPLGFLALLAPRYLIPALPTLLANVLIGNYKTQILYHYSISIMPFVFWAAVEATSRYQARLRLSQLRFARTFAGAVIVLSALAAWQFSVMELRSLPQTVRDWNDNAPKRALLADLDREIGSRGIAASDFLLPHLTHRDRIYLFPNPWIVHYWGIAGENPHDPNAVDFIVVSPELRAQQAGLLCYLVSNGIFRLRQDDQDIIVYQRIRAEPADRARAIADYEAFAPQCKIEFSDITASPPIATPEADFTVVHFDPASLQQSAPGNWGRLTDPAPSRPIDLSFGPEGESDFHTVYVRTVVDVARAINATLYLGSDDGVTVWLNGRQVHENIVRRAARLGDDTLQLELRKGKNVVLFRLNNATGGWRLIAQLTP